MSIRASTKYKKQDGILAISGQSVTWSPPGSSPSVTISISDITNLQQTPATNPKVSIKIISSSGDYVFSFTSPSDARSEQVAITDAIRKAIEDSKASNTPATDTPKPVAGPGQPAALAIAQAVSEGRDTGDTILEDSALTSNLELQRSLLAANPQLRERLSESLKEKPPSITMAQFSQQFWSARVDLLRAHAVERSQNRGLYNVLSKVKTRSADGQFHLNLSKEQIELIFRQHPLVYKIYDDLVPKMTEGDFWGTLFQSKLLLKLKGEIDKDNKIPENPIMDKYLNFDETADFHPQFSEARVPNFINLEGNEQNHSQRRGNRPDHEMRPGTHDRVPILRTLNMMSEKMIADVAPVDIDRHAPIGMDEAAFNELQLRDLALQDADNRIMLDIRDRRKFSATAKDDKLSTEAERFRQLAPDKILATLRQDLKGTSTAFCLETSLGVNDDSGSDTESASKKRKLHIGSKAGRSGATTHFLSIIKQQRIHTEDLSTTPGTFANVSPTMTGLSQAIFDELVMTQNTTMEFVHYFWSVYLSGDAERAGELRKLYESLQKSLDRIKAVADRAEAERQQEVLKKQKIMEDYVKKTGRKRNFDPSSVPGGSEAVNRIARPTIKAIESVMRDYIKTYEAQAAQSATFE